MIRAVFFDFNGVIVDDEPVHLSLFQKVLKEMGAHLRREDYYSKYLGLDDHDCLVAILKDQGIPFSPEDIQRMIEHKNQSYKQEIKTKPPFVAGAGEVIREIAATHYLGVVSGALRNEIEDSLELGGLREAFNVIVAAGEIEHGKPAPEGYIKALDLLNRDFVASSERLLPEECLVIEDSSWGIRAAQGAGMPCVALTTSYAQRELPGALLYFKDFKHLSGEELLSRATEKLKNGQ